MTGCTATLTIFPDRDPHVSDDVDIVLTCMTPRSEHKTYEFAGEVYEMHQPLETRSGGLWGDDWPGATAHDDPPVPLRFGDRLTLPDGRDVVYCGPSAREGIHEVVTRGSRDGEWMTRRLSVGTNTLRAAAHTRQETSDA